MAAKSSKTPLPASAAKPLLPFLMIFAGCMSSIVSMEYVLKGDPNGANLLTFTEFAVVLVQSIPGRLDMGKLSFSPLLASKASHVQHAVLWVAMSVLVNYAFGFNINVPIHTLFRSCNLIASIFLGRLFFGQRYSWAQLACVCAITVGIFLGLMGDAKKFGVAGTWFCFGCGDVGDKAGSSTGNESSSATDSGALTTWAMGIALLTVVQLLQGTLGHIQAVFYTRFQDKGSRNELADEYLFTSHVVSLLPMVFLWDDICTAWHLAMATPPVLPWLPIPTRIMWILCNNATQLICIKGVFWLTAHYSPLTVNITLSVRKFSSVIFSILWFGNEWTHLHSVATVLIFGGVFLNSQCGKLPPVRKKDD